VAASKNDWETPPATPGENKHLSDGAAPAEAKKIRVNIVGGVDSAAIGKAEAGDSPQSGSDLGWVKRWGRAARRCSPCARRTSTRRAALRHGATRGIGQLTDVQAFHVAAFIKELQGEFSAPPVKQHVAALRMLFDRIAIARNTARDGSGETDEPALIGLRDGVLISVMEGA
jgi:hypothetical protein